jgi:hypothetical protein
MLYSVSKVVAGVKIFMLLINEIVAEARAAHTVKEAEEEKVFWEAFDTFKDFINRKNKLYSITKSSN